MATPITFNNTVFQAGYAGTDDGGPSASFGIDDLTTSAIQVSGTVTAVGSPVTVTGMLPGDTASQVRTFYATQYDNANQIEFNDSLGPTYSRSNVRLVLSNTPLPTTSPRFTSDGDTSLNSYNAPVCFVTGTKIRTERGEIAVEDLKVGDVAVTASGALRPITWIGHREMKAAGAALPFHQQPVRVRAGAFGGGLPVNDLFLSPGHPVLVGADADNEGGVLVPVMCLINGTTITRAPRATVTYWHVELDAHDILLAEGLPAESYIDGGDRAFFAEASDHALHNPDFVAPGWNGRCRPVAVEGSVVEAERLRLDAVFAGSLSAQCDWDAASRWVA
ncbi:Hint domain-containing protein [Methylorubrum zatmanii]